MQQLQHGRPRWAPMTNGLTRSFGDVCFQVVYVIDGNVTPVGTADINDTSAIIRVEHRNVSFLFTGDLSQSVAQRVMSSPLRDRLHVTVLKAPHHGAEGMAADSFFDVVNPGVLVVPAPEWLWNSERCQRIRKWATAHSVGIYVNGVNGNIVVSSDGQRIAVETDK